MLAIRLSSEVIRASKKAISRVHPEFTSEQVEDLFIELHHGRELADAVREYRKVRICRANLSQSWLCFRLQGSTQSCSQSASSFAQQETDFRVY